MDNLELYILMCEKAEEIQELVRYMPEYDSKKLNEGDVYYYPEKKEVRICGMLAPPSAIWLPRQDQLQEMLAVKGWLGQLVYVWNVTGEYEDRNDPYWCQFNSWEQLWLAFVMKEKHNKTWDGEEWTSG